MKKVFWTNKAYIIADTAFNHEGDIDYLKKMIDDLVELKINAIKFHFGMNPENRLQKKHPLLTIAKKSNLNKDQWDDILSYTINKNIDIIALCSDIENLKYAKSKNVTSIEIHAIGLNDWYLLNEAASFNGTIILGIGGSEIDEISYAVNLLRNKGKSDILLMYGFQSYPTNYEDINLSKILKIKEMFNLPVGYADHTSHDNPNNEMISVMGAMMGVNILEKHFTLDPGVERIDYHASIGKDRLRKIMDLMNISLTVYGDGSLKMSEPELKYGNTGPMKKAIVAKTPIKKGDKLSIDNLIFKRTEEESPVKQNQFLNLLGLKTVVDIDEDEIVDFSKVRYEFKKNDMQSLINIKK